MIVQFVYDAWVTSKLTGMLFHKHIIDIFHTIYRQYVF